MLLAQIVHLEQHFPNGPTNESPSPFRRSRRTDASVVFTSGSATIVPDIAKLAFYVDRSGEVVVLEKLGKSWSEIYARQVRRSTKAPS